MTDAMWILIGVICRLATVSVWRQALERTARVKDKEMNVNKLLASSKILRYGMGKVGILAMLVLGFICQGFAQGRPDIIWMVGGI